MRKLNAGITLIELMIVLAVIAVLSSIAISNYRSYTMRANRIDGETMLMKIQVAEEKFFLQNNTYTTAIAVAPPNGLGLAATTTSGFYTLAVAAGATGRKVVLVPGSGAPAAGQARLNLAKTTVTFAGADAVTSATVATRNLVGRTVADVERDLILDTLDHCLGNRTHAANILGISIRTLRNKLREYSDSGLTVPSHGEQRASEQKMAG